MKRGLTLALVLASFASLLNVGTAGPAAANTRSWKFQMDNRYVNGKDNGVLHQLNGGYLTLKGRIWPYQKLVGAGKPHVVFVEVWKSVSGGLDKEICQYGVTPYRMVGKQKSFLRKCPRVSRGLFYIVAWRREFDGYRLRARGTLTTSPSSSTASGAVGGIDDTEAETPDTPDVVGDVTDEAGVDTDLLPDTWEVEEQLPAIETDEPGVDLP